MEQEQNNNMKHRSKRLKACLILSPLIIIISILIIAYLLILSYQEDIYERLEKTSNEATLKLVKGQLENKINNILNEDKIIFDGTATYLNDERLISYFKFGLNQPTNYTYIFKLDDNNTLKVIYSSSLNIKTGSHLAKRQSFLLDANTLPSLLKSNEYFIQNQYSTTRTLYKLFKYFPQSKLIICIGTVREQHKLIYKKYIKSVTKDINRTKYIAITIELILSALGALLISWIIKRTIEDFERTENELKKSKKTLENQLLVNSLTKLPNKNSLIKDIDSMESPKLIIIDIDDFRKMNEYYSQKTVINVVLYLKDTLLDYIENVPDSNLNLYHIDTNQFALLENAPFDMEKYETMAIELSDRLKGIRVNSDDSNIPYAEFNCTIGFSLEEKNVYETAVIALRRAQEKEKDFICYFKVLGEEDEYQKQVLGADFIKRALENDNIVPFFQPIFDKDKNILKYECLVRIIDEHNNIISPYVFLNTSKRIKRYAQIEKALIEKSLDAIDGTDKTVSINLATRDMIDPDVKNYIIEEITKRGLAKQIIFEIVEDENIKSLDRVSLFIKRAKAMGIRIAIDDFGSGYSNYSYMLSLNPDYVKIDGTLIKDLENDPTSHAIVSSIIHFTKNLGIKTIAEYVHNENVFEICKELGIDEFQGFYLSEPHANFV